ncbi:hypothetical protein RJ639_003803 [Escallonia herrerae]|uniref:Uncharacterized protein n=1 Tax=Escallonia herrerae TaxID=1293975 RepID=A0AA88W0F7_9ASTE|nr:hypothetical protein RJ639_003803 [Escallonia herrerae]
MKKVCPVKIEGQYDNYRYCMPGMAGYELLKKIKVLTRRSSNVHAKTLQTSRREEIERSIDEAQELTPLAKLEQMHKHV